MFRTDSHNNPTAFITDVAHEAGLILGIEYSQGEPFQVGPATYYTARIIGDPIATTIKVIDVVGFVSKWGQRWTYANMPKFGWDGWSDDQKRDMIGWMYQHEGGLSMRDLFPNYGKP